MTRLVLVSAVAVASNACYGATGLPVLDFTAGYLAAGGDAGELGRMVNLVRCESGWRSETEGVFLGGAQFHPDTWERARRAPDADWRSWWEQGYAVATWVRMLRYEGRDPGGDGGWPGCFN